MPTLTGQYLGNLRTEATHLASGNTVITDAPKDNQGKGEAFSPTDLVCSALASCMVTLMGIVANRHGLSLEGTTWEVTKLMAAEPRRISEVQIVFTIANTHLNEKQRELLERAALTCPVALSLDPEISQSVEFRYQAS